MKVFLLLFFLVNPLLLLAQNYVQTGLASYYIDKFDGRQTASGEKFDNSELLGCHKKLPFNTMVEVRNLSNNKKVIVRIIDRGPYAHDRIIDISKTAAIRIGLTSTGVARVEIKVVGKDGKLFEDLENVEEEKESTIKTQDNQTIEQNEENNNAKKEGYMIGKSYSQWGTERNPKGYGIQVGSFSEISNAFGLCKKLSDEYSDVTAFVQVGTSGDRKAYKVILGEYATISKANELLNQLKQNGITGILKEHYE